MDTPGEIKRAHRKVVEGISSRVRDLEMVPVMDRPVIPG